MIPQTLKGFRDFLPAEARRRQQVMETVRTVFETYGYDPLETPALEYAETLLGKYGNEADKLLYLFEDRGGRQVGLRYDQTVPTARVVAQYQHELTFPFKRYQMQPVWRAENTQKGRYREFLQCDADIFGINSYTADAEILALFGACFAALHIDYDIAVNSRDILFSHLRGVISDELHLSVIQSIDKLDKKTKDEVQRELKEKGLTTTQIETIFSTMEHASPDSDERLRYAMQIATEHFGLPKERLVFVPTLARGLDYYTGIIFEARLCTGTSSSLGGGGRYDTLITGANGTHVPAIGFALGFDRIMDILPPSDIHTGTKVFVASIHDNEDDTGINPYTWEIGTHLRQAGINTEVNLEMNNKLDKQLKYANKKRIPYVIVIGANELQNQTVTLKNMNTKEQKTISRNEIVHLIK